MDEQHQERLEALVAAQTEALGKALQNQRAQYERQKRHLKAAAKVATEIQVAIGTKHEVVFSEWGTWISTPNPALEIEEQILQPMLAYFGKRLNLPWTKYAASEHTVTYQVSIDDHYVLQVYCSPGTECVVVQVPDEPRQQRYHYEVRCATEE